MPGVPYKLMGWAGRYNAAREWDRIGHLFSPFAIRGANGSSAGKRLVLWDAHRELFGGKLLSHLEQLIGDCVGVGGSTVVNDTAIWEIIRLGQPEAFRRAFPPFGYGTSRYQIGGGRLGNSDGSLGSWFAEAIKQFGILPFDAPGVPAYTAAVAKAWGRTGPPREHLTFAAPYKIRTVAPIKSYEQAREAICNGYGLSYASDVGHAMLGKYDPITKKHWWTGRDTWPHQRPIRGVDDDPRRPGVFLDNQWPEDAHGPQEDGPKGGLWWDAAEFDRDVRKTGTECYAFSMFDGFPGEAQKPDFLSI